MTYNGWRNYETWVTKLWIDNDQSEEEYWLEEAERYSKASDLAERLKDYHQDLMPALVGVYADLLQAACSAVDWYEIAEAIMADVADIVGAEAQS